LNFYYKILIIPGVWLQDFGWFHSVTSISPQSANKNFQQLLYAKYSDVYEPPLRSACCAGGEMENKRLIIIFSPVTPPVRSSSPPAALRTHRSPAENTNNIYSDIVIYLVVYGRTDK